jgi:putative transposase
LYVIIDIFSRKVIGWEIWPTENGALAKEFIQHAINANGGIAPGAIHADRGTSMTSNTVTGLLALLGIDQTHSRPHVSNDNPYSEAQFKTLKYCPAFPGQCSGVFRTYPVLCSMRRWDGIAQVVDTGMPRDHVGL